MTPACKNCRFYAGFERDVQRTYPFSPYEEYVDHQVISECRRRGPAVVTIALEGYANPVATRWPEVDADDWCGEFAAKEVTSV